MESPYIDDIVRQTAPIRQDEKRVWAVAEEPLVGAEPDRNVAVEPAFLGRAAIAVCLPSRAVRRRLLGRGDPLFGTRRCRSLLRGALEESLANESAVQFQFAPRVLDQLQDVRLGPLQGKLSTADLQRLANAPGAQYLYDARTGNINVIQEVDGVLLRITSASDDFRIFSVGPIRANQVANLIKRGDFIPIGSGG